MAGKTGSYFVTKWFLTKGIIEVPRSRARIVSGKYLSVEGMFNLMRGNEWHATLEDAQAHVQAEVKKKRESLRAQLTELENFIPKVNKHVVK